MRGRATSLDKIKYDLRGARKDSSSVKLISCIVVKFTERSINPKGDG